MQLWWAFSILKSSTRFKSVGFKTTFDPNDLHSLDTFQNIFFCVSKKNWKSHMFETIWAWANVDRIDIFGRTVPLIIRTEGRTAKCWVACQLKENIWLSRGLRGRSSSILTAPSFAPTALLINKTELNSDNWCKTAAFKPRSNTQPDIHSQLVF